MARKKRRWQRTGPGLSNWVNRAPERALRNDANNSGHQEGPSKAAAYMTQTSGFQKRLLGAVLRKPQGGLCEGKLRERLSKWEVRPPPLPSLPPLQQQHEGQMLKDCEFTQFLRLKISQVILEKVLHLPVPQVIHL